MRITTIIFSAAAVIGGLGGCTQQVASPSPDGATMVASDTVTLDGAGGGANGGAGANGSRGGSGRNSVHFAYDSNKLSSQERAKIARDAGTLRNRSQIKVEGNSDEFGTDEYNYALGLRRAKAVKDDMVAKGVDPSKIKVVSYGESNPECQDKTQACYQQNRRADYQ